MNRSRQILIKILFFVFFLNLPYVADEATATSKRLATISKSVKGIKRIQHMRRQRISFVGYHGTSIEGARVLTTNISAFRSRREGNELGPGIYTTNDLTTAQHFADTLYGHPGVVLRVFARNYSNMRSTDPTTSVPWVDGAWTQQANQHFLRNYDYLEAAHNTPLASTWENRSSRQVKFNRRAYSNLHFETHPGDQSPRRCPTCTIL